jgi:hypothetical protein
MTFTEQIIVFVPNFQTDYYGGVYEAFVPDVSAPIFANIEQSSGGQIPLLGGSPTEGVYNVTVNDKDGFVWKQGFQINCRFGNIVVESVSEGIRKRTFRLVCNLV